MKLNVLNIDNKKSDLKISERTFGKDEKQSIQPQTNEWVLCRFIRVANVRKSRSLRFRRLHVQEKILPIPLFRQRPRLHGRPLVRFSHRGVQVYRQERH